MRVDRREGDVEVGAEREDGGGRGDDEVIYMTRSGRGNRGMETRRGDRREVLVVRREKVRNGRHREDTGRNRPEAEAGSILTSRG